MVFRTINGCEIAETLKAADIDVCPFYYICDNGRKENYKQCKNGKEGDMFK